MDAGAILANLDLQICAKRGDTGYDVTLDSEMQLGVDQLDINHGGTT